MIKVWDLDTVNTLKAKIFKSQKLHSIADATEIFIQTPKDHLLQRLTWSNYKHHNTLKVLVVIAPSSDIMFISLAYPGSISDKEITKQSGYLDMMEPYTELMVDKGFNISNECAAKRIYVVVPPGRRGSSQMLPSEVTKTKLQKHGYSKFLDLLEMKFWLTCLVLLTTYCKYVQQFQICKAPFMGRNLDWNKTKMVMALCISVRRMG